MPFNMTDSPEATDVPDWMTHNSAWIYHLPMVSVIMKLLKPSTFVELGTFQGDSYMGFCQAVTALGLPTRCTAVDTWEGDAHAGNYRPANYQDLKAHHDPKYASFSALFKGTFDQALPHAADGSVDLLHIDGFHTYEAVRHDYETWLPKLSDRGVILFHDTAVRERDFGGYRFWEEVSAGTHHFNVPYGCGLGILPIGPNVPAAFMDFLAELNTDHARILPQFLALGSRNEFMRTSTVLSNAVHDCQTMVNEWRKSTGQVIRNITPDARRAMEDPVPFSRVTIQDVGALVTDALKLLNEVSELRAKTAPKPKPLVEVFPKVVAASLQVLAKAATSQQAPA